MKTSSGHSSSLLSNRPAANVEHNTSEQMVQNRGESEWQKNAIRICGNWSEQLSSKGRVYFYNCITEVSQWQKPGEWALADINKKDLLKIINERRGLDGHSVKRTYSSVTQTERTRPHQQDVSSSPKRQKCNCDPSKVSECSKNEGITTHRPDSSNSLRDISRKVENTSSYPKSTNIKQTTELRECLGSIPDNTPLLTSHGSSRINSSVSRVNDDGSIRNSSSSFQNTHANLGSCKKISEVVTCCSNRVLQSSCRQSTSADHSASTLASQLSVLATLLHATTAATTTQTFGDASRSNRSPRYEISSTVPSSSRNNPCHSSAISPTSPRISYPTYTNRTSQGDICNRQVSDLVSHLGSFVNHDKESENGQGGSSQPPNSSKPAMSLLPNPPSSNCVSHMHDRRNFLHDRPARGPVNPIHRDAEGQQKQNIIRNIVTVLNQAVIARRDRNSANSTPGNHRTPAHTPNYAVTTALPSLLEAQNSSNGRPTMEGASPANKNFLNGSTFLRTDADGKSKSISEGLLGPPSSDGMSIVNSPSCTRTSPHFSPGVCTISSADSRHVHPSNCALDGSAIRGCVSSRLLADHDPAVSLNDRHEHFAKSFSDNLEVEKQKLHASTLILDCPELQKFVDSSLISKFQHPVAESLENEAQCEFRKFDRLHSVLYSELSGEQKKLRALVGISETKLKIHQKRKEALQELMDALETRKAR